MRIQWLIFDVGGVLGDEARFDCVNLSYTAQYCRDRGYEIHAERLIHEKQTCPSGYLYDKTTFALVRCGVPLALARQASSDLYQTRPDIYYELLDLNLDFISMIQALKHHANICVAANQHPQVQGWLEACDLAWLGTAKCFNFDLGVSKPSISFFKRVAARLGVPEAECVYIGDRVDNDVAPALAAGIIPVRYRGSGEYSCQTLRAFGIKNVREANVAGEVLSVLQSLVNAS